MREAVTAGDLKAVKDLEKILWNVGECQEDRVEELIHWAGEFNKNFVRVISADTDHDGHAEMLAVLNDILNVVLDANRIDIMDKISKAMYA